MSNPNKETLTDENYEKTENSLGIEVSSPIMKIFDASSDFCSISVFLFWCRGSLKSPSVYSGLPDNFILI